MIETDISISVNRKSDIDLIQQILIKNKFRFPVYILEFEDVFQVKTTSDYEEWELDSLILNNFPDYEFTTDLDKGRKEIRLQVSRYQSELSTDGWGRRIENPLDETKYLIKKSVHKTPKFGRQVKVLFEDKEQFYYVNILSGFNKATNEKGFLLSKEFKNSKVDDDAEFFNDRVYKSPLEAFHYGCDKMQTLVDEDFVEYLESEKKKTREIEKLPRKIVRDFVKACNNSDETGILKNLHEDIVYERRKNYSFLFDTKGIAEFKKHIGSNEQQLMAKDFKIKSSWSIKLPYVDIRLEYFPAPTDTEPNPFVKFRQIKFLLQDSKIIEIIDGS